MPISLSQLQALVALAQSESFSKAARRLRVTQPAVTQHVANLAREIGTPLVDVSNRRPVLTEAGAYLAQRARAIVEAVAALDADMEEFRQARTGTLRVGATLTIGTYLVPDLLARFWDERPNVRVDVRIENTSAVARLLQSHEFGIALVEGIISDDRIVTAPFRDDELVLVAAPHVFATADVIAASDLNGVPFVSREPGSGTRDLGFEALVRSGARPRVVLELPSGEGILRAVAAGIGVAILSRFVVEQQERAGTVRAHVLADVPLHRSLYVAALRGRTLSPVQRAFARCAFANDEGAAAFEAAL